jgi:hypothetical protein
VAVHNLSDRALAVQLDVPANDRRAMTPIFGDDGAELRWRGQALELGGYAYRWIELPTAD